MTLIGKFKIVSKLSRELREKRKIRKRKEYENRPRMIARSAFPLVSEEKQMSVRSFVLRRFSDFCGRDMRGGHMLSSLGLLTHRFSRVPKKEGSKLALRVSI